MAVALKRIVVIGAGIGGLSAAIALRKAGYSVVVYEQTPRFAEAGAGLSLWANAVKGLRKLGIEETLSCSRITSGEIRSWKGATLQHSPMQSLERKLGAPAIAIHRADLHRILLAALPDQSVQIGKAFVGFEQSKKSVAVFLSDGSTLETDLLIGADGIHSAVRRQAFPNVQPRYAGYAAWRGVTIVRGNVEYNQSIETWGRGARFGIVPIGGKRIYWFATANLPAGQRPGLEQRKKDLIERFHGWHSPIEALIQGTSPADILYNDICDLEPLPTWSIGRVTLLGDSAHATTPNLGQGACQAIESAIILARCLMQERELTQALKRYEAVRQPRTTWITNQSRQIGQLAQIEQPALSKLRDIALRIMPSVVMERTLLQAAGYEV